jgi:hypothetical protein
MWCIAAHNGILSDGGPLGDFHVLVKSEMSTTYPIWIHLHIHLIRRKTQNIKSCYFLSSRDAMGVALCHSHTGVLSMHETSISVPPEQDAIKAAESLAPTAQQAHSSTPISDSMSVRDELRWHGRRLGHTWWSVKIGPGGVGAMSDADVRAALADARMR